MTAADTVPVTGSYVVDPAQTRLGFTARQAMVAKVRGVFEAFSGRAHLDFADPGRSSAEVTIEVDSLTTHNRRRDEHLRRSFFDAANQARIIFRSTKVEQLDDDRFRLIGGLTMRGTTRPVRIDFIRTGTAIHGDGTSRVAFHGRSVVRRKEWGVAWNAALEAGGLLVSDTIALEVDVVAVRADAPA